MKTRKGLTQKKQEQQSLIKTRKGLMQKKQEQRSLTNTRKGIMQKKQEQQSQPRIGQENNITTARDKDKNYSKIGHRLQCH